MDHFHHVLGHHLLDQFLRPFPSESSLVLGHLLREKERLNFLVLDTLLEGLQILNCEVYIRDELPLGPYWMCLIRSPALSPSLVSPMWMRAGIWRMSNVRW